MRKYIIILLLVASLVICSASASLSTYEPNLSLLMHMNSSPANPTFFNDSSTNNFKFTSSGNVGHNISESAFGNATANFTAAGSGYLATPRTAALGLNGVTNYTAMLWFKRYGTADGMLMGAFGGAGTPEGFGIRMNYPGNGLYTIYTPTARATTSAFTNSTGFHQLVVQINKSVVQVYIDGVAQTMDSSSVVTPSSTDTGNYHFGAQGGSYTFYTGAIDEVAIWKNVTVPIADLYPQTAELYLTSLAPVASFTASNTTGIYPPSLPVKFTDTSTNTPTSWQWNFTNTTGNNTAVTFSTTQSPLWSFDIGNYSISLKATNADGSDLSDQVTWINVSAPTTLSLAEFTGSPLSGNAPLSVTFTDADGTGETSWGWIFGDGNTTGNTLQNPVHLYTASGVYTVNHSATNAIGTNWSNKTGYITVVNASGFTPQDIWMVGQFLQTFRITDKDTGLPIPVVDLQDTAMQTYTTTNGTGYLTESFGASNVVFISSGYDSKSISYVFDSDETHDVQLTKSTPGGSKNTWYSPHQVRLEVWNSYGNKIEGIAINATANYSSMPDSWITNLYGIDPDVANNMLNKTLIMAASTGSDGAVVFTMHGSISYDVRMTNPVTHTEYFKQIMPKDEQYILRMPTSTVIPNLSGNVYSNIGNTSLTFTEPNTSYVTMGLQYQDTSGTTSSLKFYVYFDNNKTVVYSSDLGNPGTNLVLANYTARNIRGIRYIWNYTAVRT